MKIQGKGFIPGIASGRAHSQGLIDDTSPFVFILTNPSLDKVANLVNINPLAILIAGSQRFSHCLIYLFSLGIPTVFISDSQVTLVKGQSVLVNGETGEVFINPTKEFVEEQQKWNNEKIETDVDYELYSPVSTLDGVSLSVLASIGNIKGAKAAKKFAADGIGLLRSEFLFLNDLLPPNKDRNYTALLEICENAGQLPIIIRLFDLGGEKLLDWIPEINDLHISLGMRGSRLYFQDKFQSILFAQLEAINLLSEKYDISILIPYVSSVDDFYNIRKKIKKKVHEKIKIGAMLETPAMCLEIPELSKLANFFAIGTNDLMQTFFGADRASQVAVKYLNPYSPSLVKFLSLVGNYSNTYQVNTRICGQLPLFPYWAELLMGFGFRSFSTEPHIIPLFKELIRSKKLSDLETISQGALYKKNERNLTDYLKSALDSRLSIP